MPIRHISSFITIPVSKMLQVQSNLFKSGVFTSHEYEVLEVSYCNK